MYIKNYGGVVEPDNPVLQLNEQVKLEKASSGFDSLITCLDKPGLLQINCSQNNKSHGINLVWNLLRFCFDKGFLYIEFSQYKILLINIKY